MRFCHFLSQEKTPDKRANKKTDKPHYIGPNFVSPHEVTKKGKKKKKKTKKKKKKDNQQQQQKQKQT